MRFLRQNTAVLATVGPFYDKTDGVTIETALTITNERITLTADTDGGSAPTNILDNVTGATSGTSNDLNYITGNDAGMMQLELSAADTNRVGRMMLSITDAANHVPVFHEFFVLPQAIYDWLTGVVTPLPANVTHFGGSAGTFASGRPEANVNSITANAINAAAIADGAIDRATFAADTGMQSTRSNTAQAGAAGTITLDASASSTTDFYRGMCIYITGGTGAGQARVCTAYNGTTKVATITPNWATNPDNTSTFAVMETAASDLRTVSGSAVSTTTAQLGVNVVQISGDGTAADNLETAFDDTAGAVRWSQIIDQGTAQSATGTTLRLRAAAAFADDELNGCLIVITGGSTGVGQVRRITDYASSTDTATVDTWTTTPTGTITYMVIPDVSVPVDAAGIRSAIGLASANLDAQLDALPTAAENAAAIWGAGARSLTVLDEDSTTLDLDATIRAAVGLGSANLDTQIGDLPTNSELTTALAAADDAVLAQVALVKGKTDQLTFTKANELDVNAQSINGETLTGTGVDGDPFVPAA